jgi:hypothetical protein
MRRSTSSLIADNNRQLKPRLNGLASLGHEVRGGGLPRCLPPVRSYPHSVMLSNYMNKRSREVRRATSDLQPAQAGFVAEQGEVIQARL